MIGRKTNKDSSSALSEGVDEVTNLQIKNKKQGMLPIRATCHGYTVQDRPVKRPTGIYKTNALKRKPIGPPNLNPRREMNNTTTDPKIMTGKGWSFFMPNLSNCYLMLWLCCLHLLQGVFYNSRNTLPDADAHRR